MKGPEKSPTFTPTESEGYQTYLGYALWMPTISYIMGIKHPAHKLDPAYRFFLSSLLVY